MIDYTVLQVNPIPANIKSLQNSNQSLKSENDVMTNILFTIIVGSAIFIGYKIYKNIKEENERNHSKRV